MAPSQSQSSHRHPSDVGRTPKISRLGGSKAQLCLQKILHIILTIPASDNEEGTASRNSESPATKTEDPPSQTQPPAPAVNNGQVAVEKGGGVDAVANKEIDDRIRSNGREGAADCMGLLIEAATLIFGEISENDQQTETAQAAVRGSDVKTGVNVKRRSDERWTVDLYGDMDMEPVVRSKRGRTQVLPCKYRDSVMEPLTRVSRSRAALIPNKRRLR